MTSSSVTARTPVRVGDAGGWTDTWFARTGLVCSLAAGPAVEVTAHRIDGPPGQVTLDVATYGDRYTFTLDRPPGRHPLLEATLVRWAPRNLALAVDTASTVPPGSGLGTSASVVVALVAALGALGGETPDPAVFARRAHLVETIELGWQSGVQDQLAAAHGGALLIEIDPYPSTTVARLEVPPAAWRALGDQLVTVYLGRPHRSSAVHEQVIAGLGDGGGARLDVLRAAAADAAEALVAGDLASYGAALTDATEGQRALHPALVSAEADAVWSLAQARGALGWKVNGAGGAGGTVTVLTADAESASALRAAVLAERRGWHPLDLRPAAKGLTLAPG